MHPIFFAWLGTYEDLVALGWHSFALHGVSPRAIAVAHGSAYLCFIPAPTPAVRSQIAMLSPNLVVLPGPSGTLGAAHVAQLAKVAPALKAKQGDPMRAVLSFALGLYGDAEFDPDAY